MLLIFFFFFCKSVSQIIILLTDSGGTFRRQLYIHRDCIHLAHHLLTVNNKNPIFFCCTIFGSKRISDFLCFKIMRLNHVILVRLFGLLQFERDVQRPVTAALSQHFKRFMGFAIRYWQLKDYQLFLWKFKETWSTITILKQHYQWIQFEYAKIINILILFSWIPLEGTLFIKWY